MLRVVSGLNQSSNVSHKYLCEHLKGNTMSNKIKLTYSTDARNALMFDRYKAAPDAFAQHMVLIEWQDGEEKPNFTAWTEGPSGLSARVKRGVAGYEQLIKDVTL